MDNETKQIVTEEIEAGKRHINLALLIIEANFPVSKWSVRGLKRIIDDCDHEIERVAA